MFTFSDSSTYDSSVGYCNFDASFEYKGSGIHLHGLLTLHHISEGNSPKVVVNIDELKNALNDQLKELTPGVYLHVNYIKQDPAKATMRYIFKEVKSRMVEIRDNMEFSDDAVPTASFCISDNFFDTWPVITFDSVPEIERCDEDQVANMRRVANS